MQKVPFLLLILVIINQEVEGKGSQTIMGSDCSSPRDLKIWDAFTMCKVVAVNGTWCFAALPLNLNFKRTPAR